METKKSEQPIETFANLLEKKTDNIEELKTILTNNPSILEEKTVDGWTALQLAVYYENKNMIDYLISISSYETINNLSKIHPITLAIEAKRKDILDLFINHPEQNKINWNHKETNGEGLLYQAITIGTKEMANELIQKPYNIFDETNNGDTVFSSIIEKNYNSILNNIEYHNELNDNYQEQYIKKAIKNDNIDFFELLQPYTSLSSDELFNFAIKSKSRKIINNIIQSGEVIPGEKQIMDIINIVCEKTEEKEDNNASTEIINFLFEIKLPFSRFINDEGKSAILLCIENENTDMFSVLVKNKENANFLDNQQNSPLFYAISKNNPQFVNLLIENGADVNQEDMYGNTPIIHAVRKRNREIINSILIRCHNVNETNKAKEYPLGIAIKNRDMDIVSDLIWGGAEIGKNPYVTIDEKSIPTIEADGKPHFFSYTSEERVEDFSALVKLGFNLNQTNENGDTFMLHFIKNGFQWNFNSLLKSQSNPNQKDNDGNSMLMCAAQKTNPFYFNMLLSRYSKIDLETKNKNGEDVYDICIKLKKQDFIEQLLNYKPNPDKKIIEKIFVANLKEEEKNKTTKKP